jgi:Tol biopolymer transport system component/DNA-binding winged helix-turn-helix (wHTH) protein
MGSDRRTAFQAGEWVVKPELNSLVKDDIERHIEPKVMKVLLTLASQQNRVVPKEELISAVWPDTFVGDDVLTRCISILRRVTEDDAHTPIFIQTVPKVGYRLVAEVSELSEDSTPEITIPDFAPATPGEVPMEAGASRRQLILGLVLAAFAIVALVGAILFYRKARNRPPNANSAFRTMQFTSYAGEQTQPAFAPDGKQIAFVWISEEGTSRRIYIKTIGSEAVRQLTSDADEQFSPVWSPDGKQVAYLSRSKSGLGLYIADAAAKAPPRKLLIPQEPSHWEQGALSWSPDGKILIYPDHQGSQPNSSIFQVDLATLNARSISSPPPGWEGDLNPAYSPNGKWIAFTRASETAVRDIYWMSTTDGQVHQLTHDRMNIDSLAWTSDSAAIIFSSNRGGKYALWKMGLGDKQPERLPVGTEDAYQPSVGPKLGQLAYTQGSAIWSIVRIQGSSGTGTSSEPDAILESTQQDSAPSLSPNGRFFAFQSRRSGFQEIWIASERGDSLRQLTLMGGPVTGSPSWSNHGDRIIFDSRPDGHSHIFSVPISGGHPKQLTFGNANDITPRWSHDDQTIYFRSNRGGRWQLWRIPTAGGNPQPVTTGDGIVPQESPDGEWLYYTLGDVDGIWRVSPLGGPETQVLQQPSAGYWGYWQITPRGIFYLDRGQSSSTLRIFDPKTKKTSLFATLKQTPPLYSGISVAGQGEVVLITDQRDAGRHITFVEAQP